CSRGENAELFHLVVGGYGLFGIILDVEISVVPNEVLKLKSFKIPAEKYIDYFTKYADNNPSTRLVFGRLNISQRDFLQEATLNIFYTTKADGSIRGFKNSEKLRDFKRAVFRSTVRSEYGKRLRWNLETKAATLIESEVFSRNQILNEDATLIANSDTGTTDLLHEYFIPRRNFTKYIAALKTALPNDEIDLLNITIRNVYKDDDSFMAYAREEVFGFVMLFNQRKMVKGEAEMKLLTQKLIAIALENEGTYYLPYRLHASRDAFKTAYPQSGEFFKKKLQYDPKELFSNQFYNAYKF
ncbi:MAG TPA: FAD-binding oxidoreductase, partial [Patescibacteria group bacterium]|nr:FAD-binding oxidoreductase [Patescibacteria group bacterium]